MTTINTAHCAGLWAARECDATPTDDGICPLAVAYKVGYQRFVNDQTKGVEDGAFPLSDGDD